MALLCIACEYQPVMFHLMITHSSDRWRDRGKNPEPLPPPPYEQGGWVPPEVRIQDSDSNMCADQFRSLNKPPLRKPPSWWSLRQLLPVHGRPATLPADEPFRAIARRTLARRRLPHTSPPLPHLTPPAHLFRPSLTSPAARSQVRASLTTTGTWTTRCPGSGTV